MILQTYKKIISLLEIWKNFMLQALGIYETLMREEIHSPHVVLCKLNWSFANSNFTLCIHNA